MTNNPKIILVLDPETDAMLDELAKTASTLKANRSEATRQAIRNEYARIKKQKNPQSAGK